MSAKKTLSLVSIFFVILLLAAKMAVTFDLDGLQAEKREDRQKASEKILLDHKQLIQELIKMAAKSTAQDEEEAGNIPVQGRWYNSKHLSILLLGDLRAAEAVPVLLDNIEYINPKYNTISYLSDYLLYPSVEALIRIGLPAVEPVIEKLSGYNEECTAKRNCCEVLIEMLGPRMALFRLEIAIEEAKDETVKENLKSNIRFFKAELPNDELYRGIWKVK